MSAMFDFISGKKRGRIAELEAALEHLDAYTVSAGEYDRLRDALKRYGLHTWDCAFNDSRGEKPCDCGWSQWEAELKG